MVRFGFLHGIFLKPPPEGEVRPLAENLVITIIKQQVYKITLENIIFEVKQNFLIETT